MTLQGAFATLLSRYSGEADIVIGSSIANRNRREIESLIGFFVNTLVLRTRFEDNPSFEQLLQQVRETILKAYENQDVPFEQIVEALQPERSLSHSPLCQVRFVLQNAPQVALELPEVSLSSFPQKAAVSAKFDLILFMMETEAGLVGSWQYNTDLFEAETIERMIAHFQNLLLAIVENPQQPIRDLSLLSEAERHQLLVEWNDTEIEYPSDKCIHQLFEEQVEKTPEAVAVVFESQQLSYRELNQKANQLAHHLRSLGVETETLVGICVERSVEMLIGLLGILKAGGAYVPLDPNYPAERLNYMLDDTQVSVLLTQSSLLQSLPKGSTQIVCLDRELELIEQQSQDNLEISVNGDNLAYVIYTSGSTGIPKGVEITMGSLVNYVSSLNARVNFQPNSNFALVSTLSADLGNSVIFPALLTSGCLHIISQSRIFDFQTLAEYFRTNQIDYLKIVPSHLEALSASLNPEILPRKAIILGGEISNADWIESIHAQRPNCQIFNHYGPTETTVGVLTYALEQENLPLKTSTLPLGKPVANTQIYILAQHLEPVPIGVTGEIYIGGDGLARGYLNREELTKERFIPNPFGTGKLYKTGDLARYLPDGNIEYLGRIDNQVKLRGFRIELGEIEASLITHPEIRQAVVIASERLAENNRLVAYIVSESESNTSSSTLRQYLLSKLPDYMVPSVFVRLESLPLTPNGKIDRKALPDPDGQLEQEIEYVAPRNPREEIIANIFANVLQLTKVGIHDNFFELGGHSLLAIVLISRLREDLKVEIPVEEIFNSSTVAQ